MKALGPTLIALFVAYIAYQQWQVSRATLREKLFERRFEVFKKTQAFLSSILRDAKVQDEALAEFHDAPQLSRFLFDKSISDYLAEIRERALKMRLHGARIRENNDEQKRQEAIEKKDEELKWLIDQLAEIFGKFQPYLGFDKHK